MIGVPDAGTGSEGDRLRWFVLVVVSRTRRRSRPDCPWAIETPVESVDRKRKRSRIGADRRRYCARGSHNFDCVRYCGVSTTTYHY
ncbi:hypothetical protein D8S78_03705 [Natrialba swarupiae]|nr:hypothetical protein [Natrialba swarupiae]